CAYRIPVQLLERSPDGSRPFAFGGFRIRVQVTFDDKDVEPIVFIIGGSLRGDIRVGNSSEQGRLNFGRLRAEEGSAGQEVAICSDVPELELEIDKERTPPFLRDAAKIGPAGKTVTGEPKWKVTARIGANKVQGEFPRDQEEYWDSAVYVKVKGNNSR